MAHKLVGRTIVAVRKMNKKELQQEGWERCGDPPKVLVLDDGSRIYPSQDEEGNGPGILFGMTNCVNDDCFFV
ncbi:MAG: hypothetical protein M0R80_03100 [Proteobacteria bacterium]|jgi:hypothetical protein|nr:hypothetical protein [Pseudomonadota bacterium]